MCNRITRFQVKILLEESSEKLTKKLNETVAERFEKKFRLNHELSNIQQIHERLFIGFLVFEYNYYSKICFSSKSCQVFEDISETSFSKLEKSINVSFETHQADDYYPQKLTLFKDEVSVIITFQKSNMIDRHLL